MQKSSESSTGPHPSSAVSGEDLNLEAALERVVKTTKAPNYLKVAYADWKADLR